MWGSDKPQTEREQRIHDAGFPINNTYGVDRWTRCGHCDKMFKGPGVWGPDYALDSDPAESIIDSARGGSAATGWCFECAEKVIARLGKNPDARKTSYDFVNNPPPNGSWL